MQICIQDLTAAAVALLTVGGVVYLAAAGVKIPAELTTFAGLAAGWLFRGGSQAALRGRTNGT